MVILKPVVYGFLGFIAGLIFSQYAQAADYLNLTGPNPTGCAIQVADMMQLAIDEREPGTDLSRYQRDCNGQICTYGPRPLTGQVEYQTEYGKWVVNYGGQD